MPSLLGYVEKFGKLPKNLSFSIAALLAFYKGHEIVNGALIGSRNGEEYKIMDDPEVLEFFKENCELPAEELVTKYLSNEGFHGQDLTRVEGLVAEVTRGLENIRKYGAARAMEMI